MQNTNKRRGKVLRTFLFLPSVLLRVISDCFVFLPRVLLLCSVLSFIHVATRLENTTVRAKVLLTKALLFLTLGNIGVTVSEEDDVLGGSELPLYLVSNASMSTELSFFCVHLGGRVLLFITSSKQVKHFIHTKWESFILNEFGAKCISIDSLENDALSNILNSEQKMIIIVKPKADHIASFITHVLEFDERCFEKRRIQPTTLTIGTHHSPKQVSLTFLPTMEPQKEENLQLFAQSIRETIAKKLHVPCVHAETIKNNTINIGK